MTTLRDRILLYLHDHPDGADDDVLAQALGVPHRQAVNQACRRLQQEGRVVRASAFGKIHNYLGKAPKPVSEPAVASTSLTDRPWYWEGNVQARVEQWLRDQGYRIIRVANTATKEHGKDIEAVRDERPLWVTVKGFPAGTTRTQPSVQAAVWFHAVVFELLTWRGESETADLGLALPDFLRYRKLHARVRWIQPLVHWATYWVSENGSVSVMD